MFTKSDIERMLKKYGKNHIYIVETDVKHNHGINGTGYVRFFQEKRNGKNQIVQSCKMKLEDTFAVFEIKIGSSSGVSLIPYEHITNIVFVKEDEGFTVLYELA